MKLLLDFFPIAVFFAVYKMKDLHFYQDEGVHSAIIAMTLATIVQIAIGYFQHKKIEKPQVIGLALLVVFGGVTIYIDNPAFIMWKVSVLYIVFAIALILSIWIGKKTLLERMLGKELELPTQVWQSLTWIWGSGFVGISLINAYYYVIPSIEANDAFFADGERFGLSGFDCASSTNEILCLSAQQAEESWVNFKIIWHYGFDYWADYINDYIYIKTH